MTGRLVGLGAVVAAVIVGLAVPAGAHAGGGKPEGNWANAWQGSPVQGDTIPGAPCPADKGLDAQTVRNVVFTSAGGNMVRVRLTNAFGTAPLQVGAASVALAGQGAATASAPIPLHFSGQSSVLIAAGGDALSDPLPMHVAALQRLDVSIFLPDSTGPATQHWDAQQDNYLASGDQTGSATAGAFGTRISCWMFTDGLDVLPAGRVTGTVVTLGDSITDGYLSTNNANARWPDDLARRLNAVPGHTLAVSNAGISGNDLLTFRTDLSFGPVFGPPALARLDRDVISQPGVRAVVLLEGINDIGAMHAQASDLIAADEQIIAQVHAAGLLIYGGTLVPFGGSNPQYGGDYGTPAGEAQRQLLNTWIRTSGAFDGVIDFDKALRDPQNPERLLPQYDGDHLHPNDAGYRAMADAVDLHMLLSGA